MSAAFFFAYPPAHLIDSATLLHRSISRHRNRGRPHRRAASSTARQLPQALSKDAASSLLPIS